jgi:hypothetical protein
MGVSGRLYSPAVLRPREIESVPIEQGTGRAPKSGWKVLEKSLVPAGIRTPYRAAIASRYPGSNRGCENLWSLHEVGLIWHIVREGNAEIKGGRSSDHPECHVKSSYKSSAKVSKSKKSERNKETGSR